MKQSHQIPFSSLSKEPPTGLDVLGILQAEFLELSQVFAVPGKGHRFIMYSSFSIRHR